MAINALDHVNIRTSQMTETTAFYRDLLGMAVMPPPGMTELSEAAWIVANDGRAVVHINRAKDGADFLGDNGDWRALKGSAQLHHIAFNCADYEGFHDRLTQAGLKMWFNDLPQYNLRQIFVRDPNDILIELNFR